MVLASIKFDQVEATFWNIATSLNLEYVLRFLFADIKIQQEKL